MEMTTFLIVLLLQEAPAGFSPLFNGKDLSGWRVPEGDNGHWKVAGGAIDYDAKSEAKGAKDLWTERAFADFTLRLEWRWPDKPVPMDYPVFDADGNEVKGKTERMMEAGDSGIFLRGFPKAQANLFCYPCGSGEVWSYRSDPKMPPEVRRAVTPRKRADKPPGEWNAIEVTMKGDRLTVVLNGEEVISNAQLPGIPPKGPIGLQHEHGRVQFRNIAVKELAP
jgi:hypothetical protein